MSKISIIGIEKPKLLSALYNAAKPAFKTDISCLDPQRSEQILSQGPFVDWLDGRCLKLHLVGDELETAPYNTNNAQSLAEYVIARLREGEEPDSLGIRIGIELLPEFQNAQVLK